MTQLLKIGMIGLDTSHCELFADLLNNPEHPFHVPGGRLTIAYPGGSDDFELSRSRVGTYTKQLRDNFGVQIAESMERVAEEADAILLTSVDGRVHQEQFARIAPYRKPVFIDKPFAVSTEEARAITETAAKWQVPMFSCSSLRYTEPLVQALKETGGGAIIGADCSGPMPVEPPLPPLFWYGIHTVEALYAIMGKGCVSVSVRMNEDHEVIVGEWRDGRIGTARGNRKGSWAFGGLIHRETAAQFVDLYASPKPSLAGLLEAAMHMFRTGEQPVGTEEMLEIVRFLEAANESRRTGETVFL
ncbi:Gfo/Idh/MocA family protein [Paenibacillus contaminans]|uniref:Gfo/Idh/MocA family oxidoreductase n=1 Tax=Paenibacillus contaminans TaxID=450362 RepID=A0A329MSN4_9BACL|nr:Gfo/Idh/MocA family oxidoreductase [Paenibacillus contaminans]RAV22298.1 gfo/Idh/MocA family oxidoreductase [Paenibacillus contaminans]